MTLDHLKQIALTVLSLSATVLVCIAIYYAVTLGPKVRETVANINRTSLALADWTEFQTAEFQSESYQKRVKQGFEVGRDASITIAKFNRIVIPEMAGLLRDVRQKNLVSLDLAALSLRDAVDDLAALTRDTNKALNGDKGVLPNLAALASTLNIKTDELMAAIIQAVNEGKLTIAQARTLLEDPNIPATILELKGSAAGLNATMAKVSAGFSEWPGLMTAWRKYSETANVWQKRIYLVRLLAIIAGIPGLL